MKGGAGTRGCGVGTPQGRNFISVLQDSPGIVSFLLLAQEPLALSKTEINSLIFPKVEVFILFLFLIFRQGCE